MTGKVYFIFGSTFLMGICAGAYLYVSVFAPEYESGINNNEEIDDASLVIEGQMYGGCQRMDVCASFRIVDASRYDYQAYPGAEISKGKLPRDLTKALKESLTEDMLEDAEQSIASDSCAAYVDGIDYVYQISGEDFLYELDTCSTMFVYHEDAQELLLEIWSFMDDPESRPAEPFQINILKIIVDRFNNTDN